MKKATRIVLAFGIIGLLGAAGCGGPKKVAKQICNTIREQSAIENREFSARMYAGEGREDRAAKDAKKMALQSCEVSKVESMDCEKLYKKISKASYSGVDEDRLKDIGEEMKISGCASAKIKLKAKKSTTQEFALGKVAGKWQVLTMLRSRTDDDEDEED